MDTVTSADGTPIAFERRGSGPPLVLVHGITADHTTWNQTLPFLEGHATVYAVDRRGRGDSGDADDYALEREVEDVVAVVEAAVEETDGPAVLLGHSFGGLCSLEAVQPADRVRGLVLYEPGATVDPTREEVRALERVRDAIDEGDREGALVSFYREIGHLTRVEIEYLQSRPTWQRRVDAVHTTLRETEAAYAYEFEPERFREVTTPTLLLVGEASPEAEHRDAETLRGTLPDARVAVLEGQQHVAYRMAPERFAETVVAFLNETT